MWTLTVIVVISCVQVIVHVPTMDLLNFNC